MGQSRRAMPVREDLWQPDDQIVDGIIRRCLHEAVTEEGTEGSSTLMGGGILLAVVGVMILAFTGSAQAAIGIPLLLGAGGLAYVVANASTEKGPRHGVLSEIGGPGRLPAGYLVHTQAWEAGMAEHVAHVPESQLRAAARMSRNFPGTVDDLLLFTGTIAAQVPATQHQTAADVERRTRDLVKIGAPIVKDYVAAHPPKALPSGDGKKGKKKK